MKCVFGIVCMMAMAACGRGSETGSQVKNAGQAQVVSFTATVIDRCSLGGCGEDGSHNTVVSVTPKLTAAGTVHRGEAIDLQVDLGHVLEADREFLPVPQGSLYTQLALTNATVHYRFKQGGSFSDKSVPIKSDDGGRFPSSDLPLIVPQDADRLEVYLSYVVGQSTNYISDYGRNFVINID